MRLSLCACLPFLVLYIIVVSVVMHQPPSGGPSSKCPSQFIAGSSYVKLCKSPRCQFCLLSPQLLLGIQRVCIYIYIILYLYIVYIYIYYIYLSAIHITHLRVSSFRHVGTCLFYRIRSDPPYSYTQLSKIKVYPHTMEYIAIILFLVYTSWKPLI